MNVAGKLFVADPGRGNLDARAYMAAVLGPHRVVFGQVKRVPLTVNMPKQIISNTGVESAVGYVVITSNALGAGPFSVLVGRDASMGVSTSIPARLLNMSGPLAGNSFGTVILPGEDLYAQAVTADFEAVTSIVWF